MTKSIAADPQATGQQVFHLVASLLDAFDRPLVVADRGGRILFTNLHAQDRLNPKGLASNPELNLFTDILHADRRGIVGQLESGEQEVNLQIDSLPAGAAQEFVGSPSRTGSSFMWSPLTLKRPPMKLRCGRRSRN